MKIETALVVCGICAIFTSFGSVYFSLELRKAKAEIAEGRELNHRILVEADRTAKNNDALIGICGDVQDILKSNKGLK
jgi:hypothetical protein